MKHKEKVQIMSKSVVPFWGTDSQTNLEYYLLVNLVEIKIKWHDRKKMEGRKWLVSKWHKSGRKSVQVQNIDSS